jgi:hypothetical protein
MAKHATRRTRIGFGRFRMTERRSVALIVPWRGKVVGQHDRLPRLPSAHPIHGEVLWLGIYGRPVLSADPTRPVRHHASRTIPISRSPARNNRGVGPLNWRPSGVRPMLRTSIHNQVATANAWDGTKRSYYQNARSERLARIDALATLLDTAFIVRARRSGSALMAWQVSFRASAMR